MTDPKFTIGMITIDCADPAKLAAFWAAATGCEIVADYGGFVMVGSTPTLGFQQVNETTPGKNRVHVDGRGEDRDALVARLRELGATEHDSHTVPGLTWTVMSDPEGNLFCVGNPDPA